MYSVAHFVAKSYLSVFEDWYQLNGTNIGNTGIYFKQKPILSLLSLLPIEYNYQLGEVKFDLIQS